MLEFSDISPWKQAADSPSRQLLQELSQLHIDDQRRFNERLNEACREQDAAHNRALAAAEAKHEEVRERALAELQIQREIEHQNQLKEAERIRHETAQRKLALERERTEAAKAAEAAEKAAEEERRKRHAAAEKARLEKETREKEVARVAAEKAEAEKKAAEVQTKAKEDAERAAKAKAQAAISSRPPIRAPAPATAPATAAPIAQSAPQSVTDNREAEHRRYLEIHQRLKFLRKSMVDEGKRNPTLKKQMGEARREIRKRVGQLTGASDKNKGPMDAVKDILRTALRTTSPLIPVADYLFQPPIPLPANPDGSSLLLYLLNILSKSLIQQFLSEASVRPQSADPVGILGSSVFAQTDFCWHGLPLIDILLAKFHVVCPVLFGIYGSASTQQGRQRLGWRKENGEYVAAQRHAERMTGLGAGFAALALRSFAKARLQNPLPYQHYWRALARIINTPGEQIEETHLVVLKAMVELNVPRFLEFYGSAGKVALRMAVVEFPQRARETVRTSSAAKAVMVTKDVWEKEEKLYL